MRRAKSFRWICLRCKHFWSTAGDDEPEACPRCAVRGTVVRREPACWAELKIGDSVLAALEINDDGVQQLRTNVLNEHVVHAEAGTQSDRREAVDKFFFRSFFYWVTNALDEMSKLQKELNHLSSNDCGQDKPNLETTVGELPQV